MTSLNQEVLCQGRTTHMYFGTLLYPNISLKCTNLHLQLKIIRIQTKHPYLISFVCYRRCMVCHTSSLRYGCWFGSRPTMSFLVQRRGDIGFSCQEEDLSCLLLSRARPILSCLEQDLSCLSMLLVIQATPRQFQSFQASRQYRVSSIVLYEVSKYQLYIIVKNARICSVCLV